MLWLALSRIFSTLLALIQISRLSDQDKDLEIILAIGPSTEGEATMLYIKRLIDQLNKKNSNRITVSRLAYGLPVGADLDYTDEITISKALAARVDFT